MIDNKDEEQNKKIKDAEKAIDTENIDHRGKVIPIEPKKEKDEDVVFETVEEQKPQDDKPPADPVITISDSKGQRIIYGGLIDGFSKKEVKRKGKIKKLDGDWRGSDVLIIRLKKEI